MKSTSLFFSFICLFLLFASKLPFAAEKPPMQLSFSEAMEYRNTLGYSMEQLQFFGYTIDIPESNWNQNPLDPHSFEMIKYVKCLLKTGPKQNRVSWGKDRDACDENAFKKHLSNYDCGSIAAIKNSTIAMESKTEVCEHLNPQLVQDNCNRLIQQVSYRGDYAFTNSDEVNNFRSCCKSAKINYSIKEETYRKLCWDIAAPSTTYCENLKKEWEATEPLHNLCFEPKMEEARRDYCEHSESINRKFYNEFCREEDISYSVCFYVPIRDNIPKIHQFLFDHYYGSIESSLTCIPMQLSPIFTIADLKKLEEEEEQERISMEDPLINQKTGAEAGYGGHRVIPSNPLDDHPALHEIEKLKRQLEDMIDDEPWPLRESHGGNITDKFQGM